MATTPEDKHLGSAYEREIADLKARLKAFQGCPVVGDRGKIQELRDELDELHRARQAGKAELDEARGLLHRLAAATRESSWENAVVAVENVCLGKLLDLAKLNQGHVQTLEEEIRRLRGERDRFHGQRDAAMARADSAPAREATVEADNLAEFGRLDGELEDLGARVDQMAGRCPRQTPARALNRDPLRAGVKNLIKEWERKAHGGQQLVVALQRLLEETS